MMPSFQRKLEARVAGRGALALVPGSQGLLPKLTLGQTNVRDDAGVWAALSITPECRSLCSYKNRQYRKSHYFFKALRLTIPP